MPAIQINWQPSGVQLDQLHESALLRVSDGDTPVIELPVRMLSIDTAETAHHNDPGPFAKNDELLELAGWIADGTAQIDPGLAAHLLPRLTTGQPGTLHGNHGTQASETFQKLLEQRLSRPDGTRRKLFLRSADQPFDTNGRLLAYVAPNYSKAERERMTRQERATFNLSMVELGWAASFPIYPSLPGHEDLVLLHDAAEHAYTQRLGVWQDRELLLTGYEYRMCVRLHAETRERRAGTLNPNRSPWIERHCADMTTLELFPPEEYHKVAPYNRLFIWPTDVAEATAKLGLTPGP